MIKLTQTLFFLLLVISLQAQKVKLKDYKVKAQHVNLPTIGFASDVTTFNCVVEGNEDVLNRYGLTLGDINSKIKIGGYNKVDGGGSVTVTVSIGNPIAGTRETRTQDKETKDKKKYKLYNYYYNLNIAGSYKVVDSKGNILSERAMPQTDKISTPEYRSLTELNKHFKSKYPKAKTDALRKLLNKCVSEINKQINSEYSVGKVTSVEFFESMKSKGHPDLKKFEEIKAVVEGAFGKMTAESNEAFVEAIQPAIKFWVKQEPKYSEKDKQEKKLNYACRYNAATAYFWVEDFDNALKYATMIEKGDVKSKKGKRLIQEITKIKERMANLDLTTRHFAVEVSAEDQAKAQDFEANMEAIYGSGDIRQFPGFDEEMGVQLDSKIEPGKLFHKGGDVDEGYFVYESSDITPDFRYARKIRFGKASDRSILSGHPKYYALDSIQIGEKMYRVRDVKYGEGLASIKLKSAIVEDVNLFNKTTLQIIHPPAAKGKIMGSETDLESSYAIWHKKKKKHISPDGLSFTKSMKNAVGDCDKAMAYVNEMKAKNKKRKLLDKLGGSAYNTEDLLEILRLYDECK